MMHDFYSKFYVAVAQHYKCVYEISIFGRSGLITVDPTALASIPTFCHLPLTFHLPWHGVEDTR